MRARMREAECLRLKIEEGLTFDAIAERVGYKDKSGVSRALSRALQALPVQNAGEWRGILNGRVEFLWKNLKPKVESGSAFAIQVGGGLIGQQAKLNGVDAPQKLELTGKDGGPLTIEALRQLADESEQAD